MYLSPRAALVRNMGVAVANGTITLIILLIAPMGLAGVIVNTLLVTMASFMNACVGDRLVLYLQPKQGENWQVLPEPNLVKIPHNPKHRSIDSSENREK